MVAARRGAAAISSAGIVRRLDGRASATERLTAEHVADPERLARAVNELREQTASQANRHQPRSLDFEDLIVDASGTKLFRLKHGFGGRVRWYVVDWDGGAAGPAQLDRGAGGDENTLVLVSFTAGTATVRVEEAG